VTPGSDAVLALDAAGSACSAAIWRGGGVVARRFEATERGHAERLAPLVRDTMADAGLSFAALSLIAATTGPGSFTGLRVALALARGLGLALAVPVAGIDRFRVAAASARGTAADGLRPATGPLLVALDSRRAELFFAAFSAAGDALAPPFLVEPAGLPAALAGLGPSGAAAGRPWRVAGDAAAVALAALRDAGLDATAAPNGGPTDAAMVARLAAADRAAGRAPAPPVPLYLRPPDVTLSAVAGPGLAAVRPG